MRPLASIGSDGVADLLPYLQSAALRTPLRKAVKAASIDMDELRTEVAKAASAELPELVKLRRLTWWSAIQAALLALAAAAVITAATQRRLGHRRLGALRRRVGLGRARVRLRTASEADSGRVHARLDRRPAPVRTGLHEGAHDDVSEPRDAIEPRPDGREHSLLPVPRPSGRRRGHRRCHRLADGHVRPGRAPGPAAPLLQGRPESPAGHVPRRLAAPAVDPDRPAGRRRARRRARAAASAGRSSTGCARGGRRCAPPWPGCERRTSSCSSSAGTSPPRSSSPPRSASSRSVSATASRSPISS